MKTEKLEKKRKLNPVKNEVTCDIQFGNLLECMTVMEEKQIQILN